MKRKAIRILGNRTKNRERCPWLNKLRRNRVTKLRELGKLAPYLRYKGCLLCKKQVSVTRGARLFIKNTGHCKSARISIVADLCSLPVRETPFQGR
jgi:hypothetical protein